jgi:signal transduction histidine kinase/HAMP domain-containing protein
MSSAAERLRLHLSSIRGKIALACLGVCTVVAAIGLFGVISMSRSGALVVETYDKPLMAISFARAIHADFADLQAVAVRLKVEGRGDDAAALAARLEELSSLLHDDLAVAGRRATSERVKKSVATVSAAVADWREAERALRKSSATEADWARLDSAAASVREEIDLLVNYAAGDGFLQRKQALATIDLNRDVQIGGVALAALLTALVMFNLSRRIIRPVAAASKTARRIAGGELDVPIEVSGRDELAALASAMTIMRDNIRAMVEREVAQRRSAQTRLADAIESSREGFVLIDAERMILISNREIEDFCGGPANSPKAGDTLDEAAARVVNSGVFALRTEQQKAEMLIRLRMLDAMDVEAPLADGRWVRLVRSATSDGGAIFVVSDITLLKERESMLRETAERAEAANRAKSEFLATMSHELRTPLNAVIGFSEIIAAETLGPVGDPEYKAYAGEIVSSGRGLLKIINDILLLVKSESGELTLDCDAIDLGELLEECADSMYMTFKRADVTLEVGPFVGPCVAMGDSVRLRQAVLNLMSNGAKFTPAGGTVRLAAFCAADRQVCLSVSDTGIGMREEDIPIALAPFGQIDSSRARQYEGTGLGLTLARAIIELHCGEMRIDTAPGAGTTVAVFLPAAQAASGESLRLAS